MLFRFEKQVRKNDSYLTNIKQSKSRMTIMINLITQSLIAGTMLSQEETHPQNDYCENSNFSIRHFK